MNSERWEKLESIMLSALELDGEARATFLAGACAGDLQLQREVEAMLRAHGETRALQIEQRLLADQSTDSRDRLIGTFVGLYKIDERIGRGGMGDVYRAHREDPFKQVVALKLIRSGVLSDDTYARFRTERQVLAQLVHPNITPLLDGGVTDDGLPYLVMQYVEGIPITRYCDDHQLSIDRRLDLFRTVCDAVQHAHQNLVVHRDLKPSNIIVTEAGDVTLLDFGIAKLLDPGPGNDGLDETRSGIRLMTPEYAAPEQVRGETITTATDVYALGVLLYELLAGRRPYDLKSRVQREVDRVICEFEPERPSTVVSESQETSVARGTGASRLRRTLEGDLDNIIMMALRKEPERRYASSDQLASDIDRYRSGKPVSARKDTVGYRVSKFIRRNAAVVFAGLTIIAVSLAYASIMAVQSKRIADQSVVIAAERDRAQLQAEKSEELTQFLIGIFDAADPNATEGVDVTARELLDRAVANVDEELVGQDELRGHVLLEMGRIYRRMGLIEESKRLLEQSLRIRKSLFGDEHEDVANSMSRLGEALNETGDYARSSALYDSALSIQRKLLGNDNLTVGITLSNIGTLKYYTGDNDGAETVLEEALVLHRRHLPGDDPRVVSTLSALGVIKLGKKDYVPAESLLVEAVEMVDRLQIRNNMTATAARSNLGNLYYQTRRVDLAIPIMQDVLEIRREVFGNKHPSVITSLNNLASVLMSVGSVDEAEPLMREAVALQREIGGPMVGRALQGLGAVLQKQGNYRDAEVAFLEGLAILSKELGPESPLVKRHHQKMSRLYNEWGKTDLEAKHRALGED